MGDNPSRQGGRTGVYAVSRPYLREGFFTTRHEVAKARKTPRKDLGIARLTSAIDPLDPSWLCGEKSAARGLAYTNGSSQAPSMVTHSPTTPIRLIIALAVRRVWISLKPVMRLMIQKPLSFIHGIGFEPQPIASAT